MKNPVYVDTSNTYTVESRRFVILLAFMFVALMTQINWLSFAPITDEVAAYYNVSSSRVLLLSVVYLVFYILVNFPATWALDKYGLKWGTGIGVILTGIFSLMRAAVVDNFNLVLFAQIMTAIGQPFVLNSFTKVAVNWFPDEEKATATGLGTVSMLLGVIVGMIATPLLFDSQGLSVMLWIYGIVSFISMLIYILVVQNAPQSPPNAHAGQKVFDFRGMFTLFNNRDFNILLFLVFVGLGSFNAILSDIDIIFTRFNSNTQNAGLIGGMLIIGGVVGAGILSTYSDKIHKRKIFLVIAMAVAVPGTILLDSLNSLNKILIVSFVFGFFLVAALPIALIYAAEITHPITEEASNGLMMTIGQLAGILLLIDFKMIIVTLLFGLGFLSSLIMKDTSPQPTAS